MNAKNIIIIEDEAIIALGIKLQLEKLGYNVVGVFYDKETFFEKHEVILADIYFVDILFQKSPDGYEIANFINSQIKKPYIFLTSLVDNATLKEAKKLNPWGYIVKPFKSEDLVAAIELIDEQELKKEQISNPQEVKISDAIFYKDKGVFKRINIEKILYLKSEGNYVEIFQKEKKHLIRITLQQILNELPTNFIRCHRSYAINSLKVEEVKQSSILISGTDSSIPLTNNYKSTLIKLLKIL